MIQPIKYLFNTVLIVVCTQFAFADAENGNGKQPYISFEDAQAALPEKEIYKPQEPVFTRSAPNWEDTPGAYEFTASLTTVVLDDGAALGDEGDIFVIDSRESDNIVNSLMV